MKKQMNRKLVLSPETIMKLTKGGETACSVDWGSQMCTACCPSKTCPP